METRLEYHPFATFFPMMNEADLQSLSDDIRRNGLREPILIYEGKILDGRNRNEASHRAGKEPKTIQWSEAEHGDPLTLVLSRNLHRRQLTPTQLALVAARIADFRPGDHDAQICASLTQEQAAKITNCSRRSVQSACKVLNCGIPELIELVEAGQVSVSCAERVADESPGEQAQVVSRGPHGIKEFARAARTAPRKEASKCAPPEDAVHVSSDDDQRVGAQPQATQSAPEVVAPDGKYSVIVVEPPWNGFGGTSQHALTPMKRRVMSPEAIEKIVLKHTEQYAHLNCVCCMCTNKYWFGTAAATLKKAGFDLLPLQISPRAGASCQEGPDAQQNFILIGVRGDVAVLDGQGWVRWLRGCSGAEPESNFDVTDLARHLSRGPIWEVVWTDTDAGGSCGSQQL